MALDVVGDRWSMLVVRELALGPLRFGEIASGLPGVGSRQLTERLKYLAEEGVVEPVQVASAANATGYALTTRGQALAPALSALASWGLQRLLAAPRGAASSTSVALMLWGRAASHGGGLRLMAEVTVDDVAFCYAFTDAGVQAWRRRQGDAPTVHLHVEQSDALALLLGRLELQQALRSQRLALRGEGAERLAEILFSTIG